jgi:hypothetical protein
MIDQTTITLLGGAFIGLVVAIPVTALIMIVGLKKEPTTPPPQLHLNDPPQIWPVPVEITNNHYHDHKYVVVVQVPANADDVLRRWTVARELNTTPDDAQRMISAGEVQLIEAPKGLK